METLTSGRPGVLLRIFCRWQLPGKRGLESKEKFEAFGQKLMPILSEAGVVLAGDPELLEVYNPIKWQWH